MNSDCCNLSRLPLSMAHKAWLTCNTRRSMACRSKAKAACSKASGRRSPLSRSAVSMRRRSVSKAAAAAALGPGRVWERQGWPVQGGKAASVKRSTDPMLAPVLKGAAGCDPAGPGYSAALQPLLMGALARALHRAGL